CFYSEGGSGGGWVTPRKERRGNMLAGGGGEYALSAYKRAYVFEVTQLPTVNLSPLSVPMTPERQAARTRVWQWRKAPAWRPIIPIAAQSMPGQPVNLAPRIPRQADARELISFAI